MYTVLIADDEAIIRRGLKKIVNWEQLGYEIIAEASDGEEALSCLINANPDVALMDIRMPFMDGLEVIQKAREHNYQGKIIILSGFSDFTYAQAAIKYDVKFYLNKPLNELELETVLISISNKLKEEAVQNLTVNHYREKAKLSILRDLLNGNADIYKINLADLHMTSDIFQVLVYEKYSHNIADISYHFSEILRVTNQDSNSFESVTYNESQVIILKGDFAISQFNRFLDKFEYELKPQKGSPLDTLFIAYGRIVTTVTELRTSYLDAYRLMLRRFFCAQDQHTIGYPKTEAETLSKFKINSEIIAAYYNKLVNYMQTHNRNQLVETLHDLEKILYKSEDSIADIKLSLSDLFLQTKDKMNNLYAGSKIPFPTNTQIINFITTRNYLYEIIAFFTEQFEVVMNSIGGSSSDSIIDSVIYYIEHNYGENIKLESIACLFGYNSCYLGKLFHEKTGKSFNYYVDYVRVQSSIELLKQNSMKVYDIAEKVGYRNVDYFYTKFKKYTNLTPTEYRKQLLTS